MDPSTAFRWRYSLCPMSASLTVETTDITVKFENERLVSNPQVGRFQGACLSGLGGRHAEVGQRQFGHEQLRVAAALACPDFKGAFHEVILAQAKETANPFGSAVSGSECAADLGSGSAPT
jgi:hypothetical protein